jgi:hypothetical protein
VHAAPRAAEPVLRVPLEARPPRKAVTTGWSGRYGSSVAGARRAVVVVLLWLLAACATAPAQPSTPNPAAASALPSRPREVRIDGVDPCSLLTVAQRAELGLDQRPDFDRSPSLLYPGVVSACVTGGLEPRAIAVGVSVVTTAGIEFFTSGQLDAEVRPTQVNGFPAAVAMPTRFSDFCSVVVDVARGQMVDVQARDGGRSPPIPQEQLCRDAEQAAVAAIDTLLTIR